MASIQINSHQIAPPSIDRHKNGGWRAASFILAMEATERLAFYSLAANLATYLVSEMQEPLPKAVKIISNWIGAAYLLGIPGGFIADAYLGRFYTIALHSVFYILGLGLIASSAMVPGLKPHACEEAGGCKPAGRRQEAVLLGGLYLVAIGTGGIKPCVSAFGADQFGEDTNRHMGAIVGEAAEKTNANGKEGHNPKEELDGASMMMMSTGSGSFFNWFFFSVNIGAALAFTVVVYVQDNVGWGIGILVALGTMTASLALLVGGFRTYRRRPPMGSPFTRFAQVMVAASRNWHLKLPSRPDQLFEPDNTPDSRDKLPHTNALRWLDKATIISLSTSPPSSWKVCTVTQVEELKLFLRLLPIMATTLFLWTGYTQLVTFFVKQGSTMDRRMGAHFEIPPASLPIFSVINALLVLPFYDKVLVPAMERGSGGRRKGGFTPLQRMGFGLAVSICAMVAAALVEQRRMKMVVKAGLLDNPTAIVPMSIFWLVPQYFLVGLAEIFTYVGQLHFFYAEVSEGMRSLSTSLFIAELGLGSWISSLLVTIVQKTTGGDDDGWILNNINQSKIDRFYWLLAALSVVNFGLFLLAASHHRYKQHHCVSIST